MTARGSKIYELADGSSLTGEEYVPTAVTDVAAKRVKVNNLKVTPTGGVSGDEKSLADWVKFLALGLADVRRYGASSTATAAVNTAAIQAAFDTGLPVWFEPGVTYAISSTALTLTTSGQRIFGNGATLDGSAISAASAADQIYAIKCYGSIGSELALTATPVEGEMLLNVATGTLAANDLIFVRADTVWPGTSNSTSEERGEIKRVRSIVSSTQLLCNDGLYIDQYDHTDGGSVQKITPVRGVRIYDLNVKMGGVGKAHNGFLVEYAEDCWLINCSAKDCEDIGANFRFAYLGGVDGGTYRDCTSPGAGGGPVAVNTGYGVCMSSGTREVEVNGAHFINNRHNVAGGGDYPSIACKVIDCTVEGSATASAYSLDCHEDCLLWEFDGNTVIGSEDTSNGGRGGILVRGQRTKVRSNTIINGHQYGIYVHGFDTDSGGLNGTEITDNYIYNCRLTGINIDGDANTPIYDVVVTGNRVEKTGGEGIYLSRTTRAKVTDNYTKDTAGATGAGIRVYGTSGSDRCADIFIDGNTIVNANTYSIVLEYTDACQLGINKSINPTTGDLSASTATNLAPLRGNGLGMGPTISGTIASGVLTLDRPGIISVDTEGAAGTDDLDTLTIAGIQVGDIVVLHANSSARDVVCKDGTGNLALASDFTLTHVNDTLTLVRSAGSVYKELCRSDNSA